VSLRSFVIRLGGPQVSTGDAWAAEMARYSACREGGDERYLFVSLFIYIGRGEKEREGGVAVAPRGGGWQRDGGGGYAAYENG
jgi:hypothetical protein